MLTMASQVEELNELNQSKHLLFKCEKSFKLSITAEDRYEATLEGFYSNEPLNSFLIGRYRQSREGVEFNFAMQKTTRATFTFMSSENENEIREADVFGGKVYDLQQWENPWMW